MLSASILAVIRLKLLYADRDVKAGPPQHVHIWRRAHQSKRFHQSRQNCVTCAQILASAFNLSDADLTEFAIFDVHDTQGTAVLRMSGDV